MLLQYLLDFFDIIGGFEEDASLRERHQPGDKGIQYGENPHISNFMTILKKIWDKNASENSIQDFLRNYDTFSIIWNADITNEV